MKFIALIALLGALVATTVVADTPIWSTKLETSTFPVPQYGNSGNADQVYATDNKNIFTVDNNGTVYSIDKATGSIVWKVVPTTDVYQQTLYLINAGFCLVYYDGNQLNGLNIATGATIWTQSTNYYGGFYIKPAQDNLFVLYTQSQINVLDAQTGNQRWSYNNQNANVNQIEVGDHHVVVALQMFTSNGSTTEAQIYKLKSGQLVYNFKNAVQCSNLKSGSQYLACTVQTPQGNSNQLEVVNLMTEQVAWKTTNLNINQPILRSEGQVLMLVEVPNQFDGVKGYVAAFNLANGGAAFWNITLGYTFNGLTNSIYEYNGLVVAGITINPNQNAGVQPVQFVAIDKATGRVMWVVNAPTNAMSEITFVQDSLIFPNIMGWSRLSAGGSPYAAPVSKFNTLAALEGVTTIFAEGGEYIVLAGSRVERYKF